jgi:hypothetical protein
VEPCESKDWNEEDGDDGHDDHGDDGGDLGEVILVGEHVDEAKDEDGDHVNRQGEEEHEEVSVVPPSYTVVDPGAVMVEYLDAVVTDRAVRAPGWPVELARHAPFHSNRDSVNFYVSVEGSPEIVISVFVCAGPRYDPGVHESGQGKVYEDK